MLRPTRLRLATGPTSRRGLHAAAAAADIAATLSSFRSSLASLAALTSTSATVASLSYRFMPMGGRRQLSRPSLPDVL